ncbi:hypothetical protein EOL94_03670 [bacterium]|jgi:flagellar motor protein MotB|nr:hypothetical protein [bacterium]
MDNFFAFLFLVSFILLIIGLIKPSNLSFIKKEMTRKNVLLLFGSLTVVFFVLFGITTDSTTQNQENIRENKITENNSVEQSQEEEISSEESEPSAENIKIENETPKQTENKKNDNSEETNDEQVKDEQDDNLIVKEPEQSTQAEREVILDLLKENASQEWGNDYEMVQYEYNNQVKAYDWVVSQREYPDIMTKAKQEWGNDYEMVQYEYENQLEAYKWIMAQTEYPDIMNSAKQEWGDDYEMVKYEYENQVEAYKGL